MLLLNLNKMKFFSIIVLCSLICISKTGFCEAIIHGKITGFDGKPPALAHVHIGTNFDISNPIKTVKADESGNYSITVETKGDFLLFYTAANHEMSDILVPIDDNSKNISLDVKLVPYHYMENLQRVSIVGDWNKFDFSNADSMTKNQDGTFQFEVKEHGDTVAYEIAITSDGNRFINGTHSDYFRYDGSGDYRSVLKAEPGTLKIIFDPGKLFYLKEKAAPHYSFGKDGEWLNNKTKIDELISKLEDEKRTKYQEHMMQHIDDSTFQFKFDFDKLINKLKDYIKESKDERIIQYAALYLGYIFSRFDEIVVDKAEKKRTFAHIPVTSDIWRFNKTLIKDYSLLFKEQNENECLQEFLEKNPVNEVKVQALYFLALDAIGRNDKESLKKYYEQMKSNYSDLWVVKNNYLLILNPDRVIQIGVEIPDFELNLIDSNDKVSKKSMMGKYYLMDFWATWCMPCVSEMKFLHNAYDKFKDKNFTILSLSLDMMSEHITKFRELKWKMPWLNVHLPKGWENETTKRFEVRSVPTLILVSPEGIILEIDGLRGENLEKVLANKLPE